MTQETDGKWTVVERSGDFIGMPKRQLDRCNDIWVHEVI